MWLLLLLSVTIYRCDVMARDCSTCLSLRETHNTVQYDCQWCGNICQFNGTCQLAPSTDVCPHPHIQHVILSLIIGPFTLSDCATCFVSCNYKSDLQAHSRLLVFVSFDRPYDILLVFHCNYIYVSISEATLVKFCTHVGHIKLVVMA